MFVDASMCVYEGMVTTYTLVSAALARSITVSGETTSPTGKPSVITTTARFTD